MNHRSLLRACIALVSLGTSSAALAAYTVTDLTPTDLISPGAPLYDGATAAAVFATGSGTSSQGGSGLYAPASDSNHALLWNSTAASYQDLNPAGASTSSIFGLSPSQQVGSATFSGAQQAGYWQGASTFHQLPSAGYSQPEANAISGNVIVGDGGATSHALLWQGTPATGYTLTDLHPGAPYTASFAEATDGTTIAGAAFVTPDTDTGEHAAVWNVATQAFTDLQPAGYHDTAAEGVSGNQVVGLGAPDGDLSHALLWTFNGSSYDLTDLNPAGHDTSQAFATNGLQQVGEVGDNVLEPEFAYVWSEGPGNTITATNLETSLDLAFPGEFTSSFADGIDSSGDIVGFATDQSGNTHAILWAAPAVATPEPASLALLLTAAPLLLRRSKR